MPYQISWLLEDRLMLIQLHGKVSIEEIGQCAHESQSRVANGKAPVHAIADLRGIETVPYDPRGLIQEIRYIRTDKSGFTAVIATNPIVRFLANTALQLTSGQTRFCQDVEEAMAVLKRVDTTLEAHASGGEGAA